MVSMKIILVALYLSCGVTGTTVKSHARAHARARTRDAVSPIQKVIELLGDMQSKRIKEGEVEQGQFEQFSRWCEKTAIEKQNTIADFKEQITSLTATVDTATSNIEELSASIEDLSNSISSNEEQLKESKALREKEHKDFLRCDGDLGKTVDMLGRAHTVIKKHMSSPNAALLQSSMQKAIGALRSIVDASFVNVEDRKVLVALMQQSSSDSLGEDDDSLDLQPQAITKASEAKSAPILDTIENMKEKAEASREEGQKSEMKAAHSYEMLAMSLEDETGSLKKQLDEAKKKKNANAETKASASGTLEIAKKNLAGDEKYLADLQKECMEKADAFEVSQAERAAELKVMMMAKKILVNAGKSFVQVQTADATDGDSTPSFLQTSSRTSTKALSRMQEEWKTQAADYLIRQGDELNSWVLSQVGSHISSDPFEKVKQMIQQMVDKLLEEQAAEAEHKVWCDAELLKTAKAKKFKLAKVEELSTRIEKANSLCDKLQEQIKMLASELSEMDSADEQAMEMRQAENAEFLIKKKDLDGGLAAISSAIKVLRDYYSGKSFVQTSDTASMSSLMQEQEDSSAGQPAGSAAASVIGLLEVAESDFTKALTEAQASEDAAQQEYDAMVQDNKVSRAEKMTDQKNKKAERQRLQNMVAETKLDHKDASDELNAILEYMDKLKGSCETKAPSFEERQKRRKQEMDGLQNALAILEGKAIALVDTGSNDALSSFSSTAENLLLRR